MNITFVKPVYARGWYLSIVWVITSLLVAYFCDFTGRIAITALVVGIASAVVGAYKYINGVRSIKVTDMTVEFFKADRSEPSAVVYFMHLQVHANPVEVLVIIDAYNGEIITLKDIYWHDTWDELLEIMRTRPEHVKWNSPVTEDDDDDSVQSSLLGFIIDTAEQLNRIWVAIFSLVFLISGKKGKRSEY